MNVNKKIAKRVEEIYNWLDEQIAANQDKAGKCEACGKCCDFETFGHRLFVTSPELIYFAEKIARSDVIASGLSSVAIAKGEAKQSGLTGKCRYQVDNKCTVYKYRFASCRIFCCKGDSRFQNELTEAVIKKFKALCDELKIPYRYTDAGTLSRLEDLL
jgi:Fe-S-cluster containining protein